MIIVINLLHSDVVSFRSVIEILTLEHGTPKIEIEKLVLLKVLNRRIANPLLSFNACLVISIPNALSRIS